MLTYLDWWYSQEPTQFLHGDVDVQLASRQDVVLDHSTVQNTRALGGIMMSSLMRQKEVWLDRLGYQRWAGVTNVM